VATLPQAPLCCPLTPLPKITAALGAVASRGSLFASIYPHFLPDLTDFQKQQFNGAEFRRQKQDQIATTQAASQASPRLKHICADRRVLTSRQSPPISENVL